MMRFLYLRLRLNLVSVFHDTINVAQKEYNPTVIYPKKSFKFIFVICAYFVFYHAHGLQLKYERRNVDRSKKKKSILINCNKRSNEA